MATTATATATAMATTPSSGGRHPSSASSTDSIPDLSRSGSCSVVDVSHQKMAKLRTRLQDEGEHMHRQLQHFDEIKQ